jgi:hypothetical protein
MTRASAKSLRRQRGEIETLPSGSLRIRVYAGIDALTGKCHYLVETVPTAASEPRRCAGGCSTKSMSSASRAPGRRSIS